MGLKLYFYPVKYMTFKKQPQQEGNNDQHLLTPEESENLIKARARGKAQDALRDTHTQRNGYRGEPWQDESFYD